MDKLLNEEKWIEELLLIKSILRKADLEISIKWDTEVFTYNGKNIVSFGGFKNYFAIWFYNGVFLKDPYKVLINAQEGITKSLRQWRFTSGSKIDERKILEYINEAIELEQKGLKIKPERYKTVLPPQFLTDALNKDATLKTAFENLSHGKQKEFINYLLDAKQEKTKFIRLEKIIPMILNGVGLNDKYKFS